MSRVWTFLVTTLGTCVAAAAIIHWSVEHRISRNLIMMIPIVLYAALINALVPQRELMTKRGGAITLVLLVVVGLAATFAAKSYAGAFTFVGTGFVVMLWFGARYDRRAYKTCPDCAERIKAEAKLCRFCRHGFDPESQASAKA